MIVRTTLRFLKSLTLILMAVFVIILLRFLLLMLRRCCVMAKKLLRIIGQFLLKFFSSINVDLIDFKIEFGKTADGTILLADEISPDTCRLWDATTHEKLDKDRFRRDLGNVEGAYREMMKRIFG